MVNGVSFILCYTVLYNFFGLRCRLGWHRNKWKNYLMNEYDTEIQVVIGLNDEYPL